MDLDLNLTQKGLTMNLGKIFQCLAPDRLRPPSHVDPAEALEWYKRLKIKVSIENKFLNTTKE
jgi:hypothetical protein